MSTVSQVDKQEFRMQIRATDIVVKKDAGVSPATCKLVAWTIADHYNTESGCTWVSHATIAKECQISKRQVMRAISELERIGWLIVEQRDGTSNLYQIACNTSDAHVTTTVEGVTPTSHQSRRPRHTPLDAHVTPPVTPTSHITESKTESETEEVTAAARDDFDDEPETDKVAKELFQMCERFGAATPPSWQQLIPAAVQLVANDWMREEGRWRGFASEKIASVAGRRHGFGVILRALGSPEDQRRYMEVHKVEKALEPPPPQRLSWEEWNAVPEQEPTW